MERNRAQSHAQTKKRAFFQGFKSATFNSYLLLLLLIIVGAVIGALYVRNCGVGKSGLEGTGFFMQDILAAGAASKGFASLAASAFFPISMLICASFMLGLCAIGFPFEFTLPVIHGAWLGASMAAIDIRYGINGLGICLLFIIPQAIITSVAVMVASREGIKFSRSIAKMVFSGAQKKVTAAFRTYCYKYVFCFLFAVAAAMLQAFSIILFSRIFFT